MAIVTSYLPEGVVVVVAAPGVSVVPAPPAPLPNAPADAWACSDAMLAAFCVCCFCTAAIDC